MNDRADGLATYTPTNFHTIIWDHDNTLVDTAKYHFNKHVLVCKRYGITITKDLLPLISAQNGLENWRWLTENHGLQVEQDEYLYEIDHVYTELLHKANLNPGIREAVTFLKAQKVRQCILSNARRRSLLISVQRHRMKNFAQIIWGNEDYKGHKYTIYPYEDMIRHLSQCVGKKIEPSEVLFFDDDGHAVEAATKSGLSAVHVAGGPINYVPHTFFARLEDTAAIPAFLRKCLNVG